MRYKPLVALMLLALMLLVPLSSGFAQTRNRIKVDFDRRGPMQGLRHLGNVDPRLVYALEDENGNKLNPKKVRKIKGPLYLPQGLALDVKQYKKFLRAELRTYGHTQTAHSGHKKRGGRLLANHPSTPQVHVPVITLVGPTEPLILKPGEETTVTYTVMADGVPTSTKITTVVKAEKAAVVIEEPSRAAVIVGNIAGVVLFGLLLVYLVFALVQVLFTSLGKSSRKETAKIFATETAEVKQSPPGNTRDLGRSATLREKLVHTETETQTDTA